MSRSSSSSSSSSTISETKKKINGVSNTTRTTTTNKNRWIICYPAYLDNTKTSRQGRRVSKLDGVENPRASKIYKLCKRLGLKCKLESDKAYPRDPHSAGSVHEVAYCAQNDFKLYRGMGLKGGRVKILKSKGNKQLLSNLLSDHGKMQHCDDKKKKMLFHFQRIVIWRLIGKHLKESQITSSRHEKPKMNSQPTISAPNTQTDEQKALAFVYAVRPQWSEEESLAFVKLHDYNLDLIQDSICKE